MKREVLSLFMFVALVGGLLTYSQHASSSSFNQQFAAPRAVLKTSNLMLLLTTTFDVDRTDDSAAFTACTVAPNDCSLRGAIIAANTNLSADPVVINLQPATTYNLTVANATQENGAATGDLDITTTLHSITIIGGGSAGGSASVINAAGLNTGNMRDRVFHVTGAGVNFWLQDLAIENGQAADGGTSGASTDPLAQNANRAGGGILNNGGTLTLDNVVVENCQAVGKGDTIINEHTTLDAHGGGIASLTTAGNVMITDSTFTANTAAGGNGGNFNNGAGSNAKGGSIYFEGGTLNINLSRIEASQATGGNGGNQDQNGQTNGGSGGFAQGGGAWVGGGTVTINNTTFEETEANGGNSGTGGNGASAAGGADGGGLYGLGNVTVTNSTFHLAEANGGDGGDAFGTTCLGAHIGGDGGGARGGAVFADGGTMIINTATFANNLATGGNGGDGGETGGANCAQSQHGAGGLAYGGAITNANTATLNIKHVTISLNNAQAGNTGVNQAGANRPPRLVAEGTGGGLRVGPGSVTLENTIIAGNTAANGTGDTTGAPIPGPNVDGAVISLGHNLLNDATEATGFTGPGDLISANPMLAPLANNGGPTETMALLTGSDAIDAGVAAGATFDQRGMPRTADDPTVPNEPTSDGTDIGAFEDEVPCVLECPDDISVANDAGECGAIVTYEEPVNPACGTVTCTKPSGSFFPVGDTVVTCTSSVGPSCSFKVTVTDEEDPVITPKPPIELWPPNHQYETYDVTELVSSVTDNCDDLGASSVVITSVSSDEAENTTGDGNTTNDIIIGGGCKSVQLRAERRGDSNGRVYTITLQVSDEAGNVGTATARVFVPHSQDGSAAIDDGPQYTVTGCSPNPLEATRHFVRQQYLDFLGREPDEAGLRFWSDSIESCGADWSCREDKRINTSAAFFFSIEFQQTGFLVYRAYQAAHGPLANAPVPIQLPEFKADTKQISRGVVVLQPGWERTLEENKQTFMFEFVKRARFTTAYPLTLTPSQFVERLFENTGVPRGQADRAEAIAEFGSATDTSDIAARARALRRVAENAKVERESFNQAFVLMQYFGYLRRDPNAGPDTDFAGYRFWLNKLNHFKGNYIEAEMVKAFLVSAEYRGRFPLKH